MDTYQPTFDALLKATREMQTAHGFLVQASEAMQRAGQHLTDAFTAIASTRDEHEDLRETTARLEHLVMDQGAEVRRLVEEVRQLRAERHP